MFSVKKFNEINDLDTIPIDPFWNIGDEKELKIHRIHTYPAKFPAFITTKAIDFARQNNLTTKKIGDIFCGCGTTAFEARRNNINFWGCDINPVATLIARVKSETYQIKKLNEYFNLITSVYIGLKEYLHYQDAIERLQYWYLPDQYNDLSKLKAAIYSVFPKKTKYRDFFLCAFSNILKPSSKWLTKSIKPQVDPNKPVQNVLSLFKHQCKFMIEAYSESRVKNNAKIEIVNESIFDESAENGNIDMIVTSPPYVTSYEYADLHQLSTLWLDYTSDYRNFRKGTIGSDYYTNGVMDEYAQLNSSGMKIVDEMQKIDKAKSKSVAKYYLDMQKVAKKSYDLLNNEGYALFVIGNTEYKGVRIDNAKHLSQSLFDAGFRELQITKRKISNKILTPYRDANGKFSSDSSGRKIYSEEFIVIGKK